MRLLLFILLLVALQTALMDVHLPQDVQLLNTYLEERRDLVILGNSTSLPVPDDEDLTTLGEHLQTFLPGRRVGELVRPGTNPLLADAYADYLARISPESSGRPLIVIPVNLYAFSPYWDRMPSRQFLWLRYPLHFHGTWRWPFYAPALAFEYLNMNPISYADAMASPVREADSVVGTLSEILNRQKDPATTDPARVQVALYFMERITKEHRQLQAIVSTARRLNTAGYPHLFYIPPGNVDSGAAHAGPILRSRVRENAALVRAELEREGSRVLDLSSLLGADSFSAKVAIGEHCYSAGRRIVASRIADAVEADGFEK